MKIIRTKKAASDGRRTTGRSAAGILLSAAVLICFLALAAILSRPLASLADNPESLRAFVDAQGPRGWIAFLGLEILQGWLPVPLELSAAASGYVFGPLGGFLLTFASILISTASIFSVTRICGHRLVDLFFPRTVQRAVRWFRDRKTRDVTTFFVFLIPGTPKRLFVFTAGLIPQNFGRFLFISTAARLPAMLVCIFGGEALGSGEPGRGFLLLSLTAVLIIAGFFLYRYLFTKSSKHFP